MSTPTITNDADKREYHITLPWCRHDAPPNWRNGAEAGIHSVLAALKYHNSSAYYLDMAIRQLQDAQAELTGQINS